MSHFYLDTSALVKRYTPETGSTWVKALTNPMVGNTIILSGYRKTPKTRLQKFYKLLCSAGKAI